MFHRQDRTALLALCASAALWACGGPDPAGTDSANGSGKSVVGGDPFAPAPLCIEIRGLIIDSDAAELSRSLVARQLQNAARRGVGTHAGDLDGVLMTTMEATFGLQMAFDIYADEAVTYDGTLRALISRDSSHGGSFSGHVRITGLFAGDVWLCEDLGRALVAAATGDEVHQEPPKDPRPPEANGRLAVRTESPDP